MIVSPSSHLISLLHKIVIKQKLMDEAYRTIACAAAAAAVGAREKGVKVKEKSTLQKAMQINYIYNRKYYYDLCVLI